MNPTANALDFKKLPPRMQEQIITLLRTLNELRMACRVEMSGHEMQVIVANGLSMPRYWLDRFQIDD